MVPRAGTVPRSFSKRISRFI